MSEYRLSEEIGKNKGYINRIVNGNTLPSMQTFFDICEYLNISPQAFFAKDEENSVELEKCVAALKKLNAHDLKMILQLLERLS